MRDRPTLNWWAHSAVVAAALSLALVSGALAASPRAGKLYTGLTSASYHDFTAPVSFAVSRNGRQLLAFKWAGGGCTGLAGPGNAWTNPQMNYKVGTIRVSPAGTFAVKNVKWTFTQKQGANVFTKVTTSTVKGRFKSAATATGTISFTQKIKKTCSGKTAFTATLGAAPGALHKTSPANGARVASNTPTLSWGASRNATNYRYCIATTGVCTGSWVSTNASTHATLGALRTGSTYYWQVTASSVHGTVAADNGGWSSFTILAASPTPPANTAAPVISGTALQGSTLTVSTGTWTGTAPIAYSYLWSDGTTGSSDTLTAGDVGQTITAAVTATNAGGSTTAKSAGVGPVTSPPPPPHVSGNHLLDANGNVLQLHGVDRSGTEYACIQGWGIFDGPNVTNDDSQAPLMKAWHANSALIGLNEDCWLGINGVPAAYGAQNYINAIVHETKTLESNGIYPVLSLFWSAPGTTQATGQVPMPDNDHTPAFWQSVANTFKNDPNVILRLKEEPYPAGNSDSASAWQCWNAGDVQYDTSNTLVPVSQTSHCSEGYQTVGMQSLINIIRGTGARNVIQVPGLQYANSMTHFLDSGIRPTDALSPAQLMADVDVYPNGNICGSTSCYDSEYAPVAAQLPFMFGEFGESVDGSDCAVAGVNALMSWADQHGASYSAWDWDTWGGCLQLITGYTTGNPNGNWGAAYKNHLASLP